jgi:tripartite-type tricarboxylate transporter receptor subunit TctC
MIKITGLWMAAISAALITQAQAQSSVESLYKGRNIDLVIGGDVGGGYDIYGRALARHMPKHIPGQPNIIAKNMPGAGSNKAADFLYNAAPKDGTVFGIVFPGAIMTPLLEPERGLKFDPPKFQYLGTANKEVRVCAFAANIPVKTFADAMKAEVILAASSDGGSTVDYPAVFNDVLGTKFRIVRGYKGTREITLAVERGEVQGLCGWAWSSLKTQVPHWLTDKSANIVVQNGVERDPELDKMGVPPTWDFVKSPADKQLLELMIGQQDIGRAFLLPPGVPAPAVKALRAAFDATMKDEGFLTEAKKSGTEVQYASGAEMEKVIAGVLGAPPEAIARLRQAMEENTNR